MIEIKYLTLMLMIIIVISITPLLTYAQDDAGANDFKSYILQALANPIAIGVMAIQFLMGLALGYFAAKALKYILAFIIILVIGSILSVWSLGISAQDILVKSFEEWNKIWPLLSGYLSILGIMTIGPITVGFILGALLAFLK